MVILPRYQRLRVHRHKTAQGGLRYVSASKIYYIYRAMAPIINKRLSQHFDLPSHYTHSTGLVCACNRWYGKSNHSMSPYYLL